MTRAPSMVLGLSCGANSAVTCEQLAGGAGQEAPRLCTRRGNCPGLLGGLLPTT